MKTVVFSVGQPKKRTGPQTVLFVECSRFFPQAKKNFAKKTGRVKPYFTCPKVFQNNAFEIFLCA